MFKVNDVVVYGYSEVCCVKDIGVPDFVTNEEPYYYLQPVCNASSTIYVKTSNATNAMRCIISPQKAEEILSELPSIEGLYDKNDRVREKEYKDLMLACDFDKCVQMLKGITIEKGVKEKNGKKLNMNDERNLHKVENCLAAEFAMCLQITIPQAKDKIYACL